MKPLSIPKLSSSTFAIGARQFVVHEAFEMIAWRSGVVLVVVDAEHERDVRVGRGRRDDDLLRAGVEVLLGRGPVGEEAGRLEHDVDAEVAPRQFAGSRSASSLISLPSTTSEPPSDCTSPWNGPSIES